MEIKKKITLVNKNELKNKINKYIVIHYTANNGDTAKNNADYFYSINRGASANYFVDENEIWQCVEDKDKAWHCGADRYYNNCRNDNSIGIEMCSRKDAQGNYYIKQETVDKTIELTKMLMKIYNIPLENVVRHYDVTRKICPKPFVENERLWQEFKAKLEGRKLNKEECIEKLKTILADDTIKFLEMYKYGDDLIVKLGNAMK